MWTSVSYSLCSRDGERARDAGSPEILPCRPGTSHEGTAASSTEAQSQFLRMMGLIDAAEDIDTHPTITEDEAKVLSSALSHSFYEEAREADKFFTPGEYRKCFSGISNVCHKYALRSKGAVDNDEGISSAEAGSLLNEYMECSQVCCCPGHVEFRSTDDLFYSDCLGRLICLPPVLTDHYGGELVEALFPFLFQKAKQGMNVRKCGLGSPYTVNFVLQMPSGSVCQFTGRPDFSVNSSHAGAVVRFTLRGVGEIQSPPWRRKESKSAALSQAGIYTLGQFANGAHSGPLPAIVIHKDKTAQVAIGRLNCDEKKVEHSLGTVTFRLIGQVDSLDLKDPRDLRVFSGFLKGVMDIKN